MLVSLVVVPHVHTSVCFLFFSLFCFFFFQSEDGIRDLVRSRGLGDVYKRQLLESFIKFVLFNKSAIELKFSSDRF